MRFLGIFGICALLSVPAFATDDIDYEVDVYDDVIEELDEDVIETEEIIAPRAVTARMTCDEINERVAELREDVKSYPDLAGDLESMLARQRTQCAARAKRRPVHNYENVNPLQYIEDVAVEEEPAIEEQAEITDTSDVDIELVAPKTPEELAAEQEKIAENRANGLCDDGTKPNRYGCCAGEKFKEISQMNFACCPKDGDGECIEPRKK